MDRAQRLHSFSIICRKPVLYTVEGVGNNIGCLAAHAISEPVGCE